MYQDCALRCQNCRRGFQALQIPNPPIIAASKGGSGGVGKDKDKDKEKGKGKEKEKEKEKGNSFWCWGFFPLGFSMTAWKKQNQAMNLNGSSNWVPFSPMFACPMENGGGGFNWFDNSVGKAFVGPKNGLKSIPRVYVEDEEEDLVEVSEPSDLDSSDGDWRNPRFEKSKNKRKKRRKMTFGGSNRGRPRKNIGVTRNVASGGGVSVDGEEIDDGSGAQELVFGLAAGDKSDARKTASAALARKLSRRHAKDVGRLDLNVELNNDGEDHAPKASAGNGVEDVDFFKGLDEFFNNLPILNVDGDEKAKPSYRNQP